MPANLHVLVCHSTRQYVVVGFANLPNSIYPEELNLFQDDASVGDIASFLQQTKGRKIEMVASNEGVTLEGYEQWQGN